MIGAWCQLWFGDERGYNATANETQTLNDVLWFGDERGYNATIFGQLGAWCKLWFGDLTSSLRHPNSSSKSLAIF